MCVIIVKKAGERLPFHKLDAACDYNDDGFGYMYVDPETKELVVKKELFASSALAARALDSLMDAHAGLDVVYHLRFGTHGVRSIANVHPFQVLNKEEHGRDVWMMHNGVINIKSSAEEDKDKSDTVIFMEYIVRPILAAAPDLLYTHAFQELIGDYTSGSRLLFMDDQGVIVKTGTWSVEDNCDVSNQSYFKPRVTYTSMYSSKLNTHLPAGNRRWNTEEGAWEYDDGTLVCWVPGEGYVSYGKDGKLINDKTDTEEDTTLFDDPEEEAVTSTEKKEGTPSEGIEDGTNYSEFVKVAGAVKAITDLETYDLPFLEEEDMLTAIELEPEFMSELLVSYFDEMYEGYGFASTKKGN